MSLIDRTKLYYDQAKHMTTLAAGANAFVVVLFEKLAKAPKLPILVPASITLFCAALGALLVAMVGFASQTPGCDVDDVSYDKSVGMFVGGTILLWVGFLFLLGFVWANSLTLLF